MSAASFRLVPVAGWAPSELEWHLGFDALVLGREHTEPALDKRVSRAAVQVWSERAALEDDFPWAFAQRVGSYARAKVARRGETRAEPLSGDGKTQLFGGDTLYL